MRLMRALYSSIMTALVVVALFWGNCLSCPQVLLSLRKHPSNHDCCKKKGQQSTQTCSSRGLQHFVKADPAVSSQATPAAELPLEAPADDSLPEVLTDCTQAVQSHAPPDPLTLHGSFRV
jgi:hypothetical protein